MSTEKLEQDELDQDLDSLEVDRSDVANSIVMRSAAVSAATGIVPLPGYDVAVATAIDVAMINKLCQVYDRNFSTDVGTNCTMSLVGAIVPKALQRSAFGMLKAVPLVGSLAGYATMPALNFGITYGLGKLFIRHFEALERGDRSLLNFNSAKTQVYLQQQISAGVEKYGKSKAAPSAA